MDRDDKTINLWCLATVAAYKRAQEITFAYSGKLVKGEKLWHEITPFKHLDKAIVKSMWRHYVK